MAAKTQASRLSGRDLAYSRMSRHDRKTASVTLEILELAASGYRSDAEIIDAFVSDAWVDEGKIIAITSVNKRNSTSRYEVECAIETLKCRFAWAFVRF